MATCIIPEDAIKLRKEIESGRLDANKILDMLPENQAKVKAVLEEMVAEKLGLKTTEGEVKEITIKAKKIQDAEVKLGDDLGNPSKVQETLEFFQAKKEMDDYLASKHPVSQLKVTTSTIGRGMMLFSAKSPLLNIGSNLEVALTETISRRVANWQRRGTDGSLAKDYIKMVNKIYQKTGYDLSRMNVISDTGFSVGIIEHSVHTQGKGIVRKTGRVVEDIVFKQLMGAPDVAFSSLHFADSVNLGARKLTGKNKVAGKKLMEDAMRIEPMTVEGKVLREQGILDAQVATWTNKTWASNLTSGIRNIMNSISGDARAGDYLLPFIKTPANVIATGMDYAGGGAIKALISTVKAIRTGNLADKVYLRTLTRGLVRSGIGLTAAAIIAAQFDEEDFMGAYDPQRAQIETLRNSTTNAIRIGNKWVSTDWLGPLAIPVTAMLYAKKYGDTLPEQIFQYGKGIVSQIQRLPGVEDVMDFAKAQSYSKNKTLEEMTGETGNWFVEQFSSRLIPSFMGDIAKSTDEYNRVAKTKFEALKAKIPGWRQTLPVRTNVFGQKSKTEPAWSTMLFGSRVKTDKENRAIKELSRLSSATDKGITFTDWDKTSSTYIAQFKKHIGTTKFNQAKADYGRTLKARLDEVIRNPKYIALNNDDKLKIINNLDTEVTNKIYKKYGFKPKSTTSKKIKI